MYPNVNSYYLQVIRWCIFISSLSFSILFCILQHKTRVCSAERSNAQVSLRNLVPRLRACLPRRKLFLILPGSRNQRPGLRKPKDPMPTLGTHVPRCFLIFLQMFQIAIKNKNKKTSIEQEVLTLLLKCVLLMVLLGSQLHRGILH